MGVDHHECSQRCLKGVISRGGDKGLVRGQAGRFQELRVFASEVGSNFCLEAQRALAEGV